MNKKTKFSKSILVKIFGVLLISLLAATNVSERVYALGGGGSVTITGKVSDANSSGISGASVKYEYGTSGTVSTTTDDSGCYELTDVPKNTLGTFTVSKDGYDSCEYEISFEQDATNNVTLNAKKYRATFDLDGGTRNDPEEDWACKLGYGYDTLTSAYFKEFNYGTDYSTILAEWNDYTPTKTGYAFDGWTPNSGTLTEATTFTATWKQLVINVTENPASHLKYDGTAQSLGTITSDPADATIEYKVDDGAYSTDVPTATNAGTYTVGYKVTKTDYTTKEGSFNVTIEKRKITLTSGNDMVVYAAGTIESAHNENVNVTGDGLADGETLAYSGFKTVTTVSYTPTENTFEYAAASESAFNADNYEITVKYGKLILVDELAIIATDQTFKYDGTEHNIEQPIVITNGSTTITYATSTDNQQWSEYSSSVISKVKNAGVLYIHARATKGANTKETTYKITVEKRTVTLTSESETKEYDGTPLTNSDVTYGALAGGESFVTEPVASGTITKAGQQTNTIDISSLKVKSGSEDTTANYEFIKDEGTLTVTAPSIDTSKSSNVTLDGNKLTTSFKQNNASSLVVDIDSSIPAIDNCEAALYNDKWEKVCDCTCETGSIKVTVPTSYLNTLSAGTYEMKLGIKDTAAGETVYTYDLSITVNGDSVSSNTTYQVVNTSVSGTNSTMKLVSLLSLVTIAGAVTLKKRKH